MKITKRIQQLRDQLATLKNPKDRAALETRIKALDAKRRAKYGKD